MLRLMATVALIGFVLVSVWPAGPASALTEELAKKCRAMAIKAHPTTVAGSKQGSAKAQADYFRKCIENNGKVDDEKSE